ncbi:hypothetical protein L3X38_003397 [Prunus dulcis]|uniref:Transposable element protein n=1 Tax=Prunus dulcis TaxID=3755 RepID=A0AAD5F1V0_PRUDU|nr:hypothetical protein L3X38_003397 [Prunus dulcis]
MGLVDIAAKLNRTKSYGGVVNVVTVRKYENKGAPKSGIKKQSQSQKNNPLGVTPTTKFKCYFCQEECHMKKNCHNYKKWFEKNKNKGNKELAIVSFESNLVDIPSDSWWLDTDREGEYYGHLDEGGRRAGPFARYLQDNGIDAQYTTPGTSQHNIVAKRRNRTLKDMFIEYEENAIGNGDFIFEEEGDVAVIENDEQDVTSLIPLSETVLEPHQFEEPVDQQEQPVKNPELDNPQEPVQPRRSDRPRRPTANSNYVYLQKADFDIGDEADPTSFKENIESQNADKWREAMLNELESMKNNQV